MHTVPLDFRLATVADTELLIGLMRDFYAEDKLDFDDTRVRRALASLLCRWRILPAAPPHSRHRPHERSSRRSSCRRGRGRA